MRAYRHTINLDSKGFFVAIKCCDLGGARGEVDLVGRILAQHFVNFLWQLVYLQDAKAKRLLFRFVETSLLAGRVQIDGEPMILVLFRLNFVGHITPGIEIEIPLTVGLEV